MKMCYNKTLKRQKNIFNKEKMRKFSSLIFVVVTFVFASVNLGIISIGNEEVSLW